MQKLKEKRTIFVSEADFQLELAWIIKDEYPNAKVRLEYCPAFDLSMHIDILVIIDRKWIPIELKYKTKLLLAMIYRNYLCSKEEQLEYDKILCQNEENHQKYLREKYNPDNLFKKKDAQESSKLHTEKSQNALIEYKQSFFAKFKNFIFKILHINNKTNQS